MAAASPVWRQQFETVERQASPRLAVAWLARLVGSTDVEELRFPSGYVGLIIGRSAQWHDRPAMVDWPARHSELE